MEVGPASGDLHSTQFAALRGQAGQSDRGTSHTGSGWPQRFPEWLITQHLLHRGGEDLRGRNWRVLHLPGDGHQHSTELREPRL